MSSNAEARPQRDAMISIDRDRLARWIVQHDAILDELHADLVRRSIVHLTAVRDDLARALEQPR